MNLKSAASTQTQPNNHFRLAWRLEEIAESTGLSIPFLRKEIRNLNLRAKKRGRCVIVMDSDLKAYLDAE